MTKIRKVESRSKRRLDYAEREYLRRQPKITKKAAVRYTHRRFSPATAARAEPEPRRRVKKEELPCSAPRKQHTHDTCLLANGRKGDDSRNSGR